jgi:hypothetical protein
MASLDNVSSIDKVFRNGAPRNGASLVWVDKIGDEPFKAQGEAFGMHLKAAVLEGDGPKVFRFVRTQFFW